MNIPQCAPYQSYNSNKDDIKNAITRVLDSGWYILGNEVSQFETAFSNYNQASFSIGVGSGTDALFLALRALDIGPGDGVITVSHTAVATVTAIRMTGATPILFDIDKDSYNIDVDQVENYLTKNGINAEKNVSIKAMIPVHLYGNPCDMEKLVDLASKFDIKIVEDCAQAHGAEVEGKKVGTFGQLGCFSFYPTKNLGALGDGGAIITNDKNLADKIKNLRQYGWEERYISSLEGFNSRLDELQAAILNVKLLNLYSDNENRIQIGKKYLNQIKNEIITLPVIESSKKHVFHQFVVRSNSRNELINYLGDRGISTAIHYPVPVHLQEAYQNVCICPFEMDNTEKVSNEILSLPIFPELKEPEIDFVIDSLNNFNI